MSGSGTISAAVTNAVNAALATRLSILYTNCIGMRRTSEVLLSTNEN